MVASLQTSLGEMECGLPDTYFWQVWPASLHDVEVELDEDGW